MTQKTESGWTKGPWRIFLSPDGEHLIGIGEATGEAVADCGFGVWRSGAEKIANARLIAASPALAEALEKSARQLERAANAIRPYSTKRADEIKATADEARTALLLAKGQEKEGV